MRPLPSKVSRYVAPNRTKDPVWVCLSLESPSRISSSTQIRLSLLMEQMDQAAGGGAESEKGKYRSYFRSLRLNHGLELV